MNLSTTYLGLRLPHPLIPGASPLVADLDSARRLEDAGAAALVLRSLFEEQIVLEEMNRVHHLESHQEAFAEALSFLPDAGYFSLGPDEYLELIHRLKKSVDLPLIASLNGESLGGWLNFSRLMEKAGADALELNFYHLAIDPNESGEDVEAKALEMLRKVREEIRIPIAVKLSPFYSSLPHFANQLAGSGADGLILFNRFYEPDLDTEELQVVRTLELSDSRDLLLRLRWLAILSGSVATSLAVSGGVHTSQDAIKAVMAGAHAVQMVSALLRNGPGHLARIRREMVDWLEEHEYDSLEQMRGSMSRKKCPDPRAYDRVNYVEILQSWERVRPH